MVKVHYLAAEDENEEVVDTEQESKTPE